jgi:tol-pal system beta propeller repeat protein TolB
VRRALVRDNPLHLFRVGLVVAILMSAAACGADEPPAPGEIVYASAPEGIGQLDVMAADGSNQQRLTPPDGQSDPSWSPDGTQIAYSNANECDAFTPCSQICVVNRDGSGNRCLTRPDVRSEEPAWSPSGDEIAFVRWDYEAPRDAETDIYTVRVDGMEESRLTAAPGEDESPSWSPDGEKIVFSSHRDSPPDGESYHLYVMDTDGSNPTRLTDSDAWDYWPSWSPDGDRIAFVRTTGEFDLWLMNADGTEQRQLLARPTMDSQPAWSPDAAQIVFTCEVEATGSEEICVMTADDGVSVRALTNYQAGIGGAGSPDWAPVRGED